MSCVLRQPPFQASNSQRNAFPNGLLKTLQYSLLGGVLLGLLQGQTPPLTGVIERIVSQQQFNPASGELMGQTVLSLSRLPAPALRVYFPSNRQIKQVSLEGRSLTFSHQGGFLTIFTAGTAAQAEQKLSLTYSSKHEGIQGVSPLFELENYRLNYSLETQSGRFQAQSQFQLKSKKPTQLTDLPLPKVIHLALNRVFTVESVQVGGRSLPFVHRQGQLRITLPEPLSPGRSYSLDVRYSGKLPAGNKYQIWDTPFGGGPYFYPAHPLRPGAY